MNLHKLHKDDEIKDIFQTSKLAEESKGDEYECLQEIIIHFELQLRNKDGADGTLTYCNLKLSSEVIRLITET